MPTPSLSPIDAFTYITSLTVSLGMLYSLLFLLVPQCSALEITSGGREACTMGVGVYLAGAVLVVLKSILRVPALLDAVPGTGWVISRREEIYFRYHTKRSEQVTTP